MIIGITGRAGVGKSEAAKHIQSQLQIPVIDLDTIGHELLENTSIRAQINSVFGDDVFDATGAVSRPALGNLVFADATKLSRLNDIMHPAIKSQVMTRINSSTGHCIVVGALIKEIDLIDSIDHIILIQASDESLQQHSASKAHIRQNQLSDNAYKAFCHSHIMNDFTKHFSEAIIQHVNTIIAKRSND